MKKKDLTQKILLGLIGASFAGSSMFMPLAFASPAEADHAQVVNTKEGASDFTNRIQSILDEYHKENEAQKEAVADSHDTAADSAKDGSDYSYPPQTPEQHPYAPSYHWSQPAQEPAVDEASEDEERYNFDWQGTPLANSIYAIAKMAGKDVVINGSLEGTVYMSLHDVTYMQALQRIAEAFNLNYMVDGNSVVVSTSDLMKQAKTFRVHNIYNMESLKKELKGIGIDEDNIYPNTEQRTVSITGTAYQLKLAEQRLKEIDKPISQCLVVAQLIEINHGKNLNLGFDYTLPSYTHTGETSSTSSSSSSSSSMSSSSDDSDGTTTTSSGGGTISSLKGPWLDKLTFGVSTTANRALNNGKVIARPMVMMMNGQEGTVNFGDSVPIMTTVATTGATTVNTEYHDVGTKLTITPSIDDSTGTVTMKVNTEVSTITGYQQLGNARAPQTSTRSATTSAHLRSGQSLVIGGLMTKNEMKNLSGIPGLMNLPILGELFKFRSTSHSYGEVYIMLTPYIVTDDIDPQTLLKTTYKDTIKTEDEEKAQKEAAKAEKAAD